MATTDDDTRADDAFKALRELFSHVQPGKSRYSGIRYTPEIRNGEIVFVPDANDLVFDKAFNEALDELFGAAEPADKVSKE
jgi:hypothetical protein